MTLEKQGSTTIDFYSDDSLIKNFILSKGPRYIRIDLINHDDEVLGYFHINKDDKSIIDNHIIADTEVLKNYLTSARGERILNYIKDKLNRGNILENIEMSLEDFKREFGSYTLEHTSNPFSKEDEINIYKGKRHIGQYFVADKELVMYENYKGKKIMKKKINEEYGSLKGEPYMEEIANDLEIGSTYRDTEEYSWSLLIDGMEIEESISSNEVLDWLCYEISFPVRDGLDYYNGLNLILDKDRLDYENGQIAHDLERLGFDTRLFEDTDEIQTWIDYDLNLEVHENEDEEDMEENYKGKKIMKKKINEDAKIIANLYNDFKPWSGAVATWEKITDADMLEDLDRLLEEMYPDGIGMTELNDLLWFEDAWVLEQLGLAETEDEEEYDESFNENEEVKNAIALYKKQGFLDTEDEEDARAIEVLKNADYTVKVNSRGTAHVIELERMGESLKSSRKSSRKMNEYKTKQLNGKWVLADNDGFILTSDKFDTQEEAEAKIKEWEEEDRAKAKKGGYPVANAFAPKRVVESRMNENDEVGAIWDYLVDSYTATQEELELVTSINGYSVETLNDVIYARTGLRDIEQLKAEYGEDMEESLDEISDETVNNTLSKRNQAYNYTNKKWVDKMFDGSSKREQNKAWKEREKASTKRWNAEELAAKRKARKEAQQESLSTSLIKSAKAVLSMNESDVSEVSSWSFKAKGFSKIASNKQPTFGNSELNGTIHENLNGKISGIVMTNHSMSREEVEESLKNALMDNGFKTTVISELVNLY